MAEIHSTAIVEGNVSLASGVVIGAYCVIKGNVNIGENTIVYPHVCIEGNTTIGKECAIFSFASIGSKPQDYKYHGESTEIIIGDGNIIREYVTISPGTKHGGGITKVGNKNFFMISSHIGHDVVVGNNCTIANNVPLGGHVVLGDNITIGGNSAVHQFVCIGSYAMVGGMVGVKENIMPFALATPCNGSNYAGVRGVNIIGLKRNGFTKEDIQSISTCFDVLRKDGTIADKILKFNNDNKNVQEVINFIKHSQEMQGSKGLAPFVRDGS